MAERLEITGEELESILSEHKKWSRSDRKEGEPVSLDGANLKESDLTDSVEPDISIQHESNLFTRICETYFREYLHADKSGSRKEFSLIQAP